MMPQTPLMLQTVPLQDGSFPCIGRFTTPSPANMILALWSSREVSLHRLNVLRGVIEERIGSKGKSRVLKENDKKGCALYFQPKQLPPTWSMLAD